MSFFAELRRRNVVRVGIAYLLVMLGRLDEAWELLGPLDSETSGYKLDSYDDIALLSRDSGRISLLKEYLKTRDGFDFEPEQTRLNLAHLMWPQGPSAELTSLLDSIAQSRS